MTSLEHVDEWDEGTKLHRERESLGFYFSGHPIDSYSRVVKNLVNFDSRSINKGGDQHDVVFIALIVDIKVVIDRKGNPMAFVSVEDIYGSFEVIAFSDCYEKYRSKLQKDSIVCIKGKLSSRNRARRGIIADDIFTIDEAVRLLPRKVHLSIRYGKFEESEIEKLKAVIRNHFGEKELVFHFKQNGHDKYVVVSRGFRIDSTLGLINELKEIKGVEDVELSL